AYVPQAPSRLKPAQVVPQRHVGGFLRNSRRCIAGIAEVGIRCRGSGIIVEVRIENGTVGIDTETAGQVERDSGLDTLRGLLPDLLDRPANGALHGEIVLDDPIGGQGSPARAPREHSFHAAFDLIAAGVGEGNLVWGSGWSGQ